MAQSKQKHLIRDWLWPSPRNNHHPHLVRPHGLLLCLSIILALQFLGRVTAAHPTVLGYATNVNVSDLYNLTNRDRAARNLNRLHLNSQLVSAAQAKARYMFKYNYWAHVAPNGTLPWVFITQAGYNYSYAGENLAKDFNTSSGVEAAWMASAEHRANILNTHYTDVGFAAVNGTLVGGQTTLVVAFYANHPAGSSGQVHGDSTQPTTLSQSISKSTKSTPKPKAPLSKPAPTATVPDNQVGPTAATLANFPTATFSATPFYSNLTWSGWLSLLTLGLLVVASGSRHIAYVRHKRTRQRVWHTSPALWQTGLLASSVVIVLVGNLGVIK